MKDTIRHTPKNLSFSKRIVKHLPESVRNGLPAEISVVSVSEKESAGLNRRYRKKRAAANVLSFLYSDAVLSTPRTRESRDKKLDSRFRGNDKYGRQKAGTYGEIILCPAVIRREAKAQHHTFDYQMTWMILHGIIHLSGLHHEESASAEKKFSRTEQKVLQRIFNGAAKHRYGG